MSEVLSINDHCEAVKMEPLTDDDDHNNFFSSSSNSGIDNNNYKTTLDDVSVAEVQGQHFSRVRVDRFAI